jgi:hypothetical protein
LESCRLEKTALLLARAQEFLKERRVIFPAESALLRLVGEQKKLAHESIVTRIADSFSPEMAETIARSRFQGTFGICNIDLRKEICHGRNQKLAKLRDYESTA